MKKAIRLFIMLTALILLCSCSDKIPVTTDNITTFGQTEIIISTDESTSFADTEIPVQTQPMIDTTSEEQTTVEAPVTEPVPLPELIGMYVFSGSKRVLAGSEYVKERTPGKDIDCFEVFPTLLSEIGGGNYGKLWDKYSASLPEIFKIGYRISFEADGKAYSSDITAVEQTMDFSEYFEIYLYDDIHQIPGERYSHLTKITFDTLITSIKLTAAKNIEKVTDITLTAYLYNETGVISEYTVVLK